MSYFSECSPEGIHYTLQYHIITSYLFLTTYMAFLTTYIFHHLSPPWLHFSPPTLYFFTISQLISVFLRSHLLVAVFSLRRNRSGWSGFGRTTFHRQDN